MSTCTREGLDIFFRTFIEWSAAQKVQARIQPHYRFSEELIERAGTAPRPETEVCTTCFETIADPRKATSAGAYFYGREIVSARRTPSSTTIATAPPWKR